MLRYRIDMLSVAAVVAVLGLQIVAVVRHWPWYTALLIIFLLRYVNLVEHNHVHLRIFRQAALNEFLGWMCFLSNGVPLEFYEIHHVRNHHRFNQRFDKHEQDWSSLYGFSGTCFPEKPIGLFYYILTFPVLTVCHCLLAILRKPGSRIFRRFARSISVVGVCSASLMFVSPWRFLGFFLVPWMFIMLALGRNNYAHHYGCSMKSPYDSAMVNLRFYSRYVGFNIGYHVAHHIRPSLHWSLLPQYHNSIQEHIPKQSYALPLSPLRILDRGRRAGRPILFAHLRKGG